MNTAEILRGLPYFADLSDDLLDRVCASSKQIDVPANTTIIEEGSDSEEMYIVVTGELAVTKLSAGKPVELARLGPSEVVGEIALLDGAPRTASVSSIVDSHLIRVPAAAFEELITDSNVVRRMFRTVTSRLRGIEETLRHEERMSALGRMAAQLMHELNNPAAAVARSAGRLSEIYEALGEAAIALAESQEDFSGRLEAPDKPDALDPLTRSDREEETAEWLEDAGVEEAWDLAPAFVNDGYGPEELTTAARGLDAATTVALARWLGYRCLASQIIGELSVGVGRISELVRVVKDYSFLDQAPVQEIDVVDGISDTLILLKHKLKNLNVVTDFESDLAVIEASGRDINQVWTNLIDNAAQAMDGGGTLTLTAANRGESVVVTVGDTGSGIEADNLERIFDPFFTTKEPGQGTGLGLHTVHNIIAKAGGDISVESSPEGTIFEVSFPKAPAGD